MDRFSRQKISNDLVELNNIINQLDIIVVFYRLLYPTTVEYIVFSRSCEIFTKIDHILGHKPHDNKLKI